MAELQANRGLCEGSRVEVSLCRCFLECACMQAYTGKYVCICTPTGMNTTVLNIHTRVHTKRYSKKVLYSSSSIRCFTCTHIHTYTGTNTQTHMYVYICIYICMLDLNLIGIVSLNSNRFCIVFFVLRRTLDLICG